VNVLLFERFEAFAAVKIQVEVFWDRSSVDLRNVGILPKHYTASQPRRPRP